MTSLDNTSLKEKTLGMIYFLWFQKYYYGSDKKEVISEKEREREREREREIEILKVP